MSEETFELMLDGGETQKGVFKMLKLISFCHQWSESCFRLIYLKINCKKTPTVSWGTFMFMFEAAEGSGALSLAVAMTLASPLNASAWGLKRSGSSLVPIGRRSSFPSVTWAPSRASTTRRQRPRLELNPRFFWFFVLFSCLSSVFYFEKHLRRGSVLAPLLPVLAIFWGGADDDFFPSPEVRPRRPERGGVRLGSGRLGSTRLGSPLRTPTSASVEKPPLAKLRHKNGMRVCFLLWRANLYTYEYINIHIF